MKVDHFGGAGIFLAFSMLVRGMAGLPVPAAEVQAGDQAREEVVRGDFQFEVEDDAGFISRADSGQIWLYYYGWGYFVRYPLAEVAEGRARVELSRDLLREKVRPPANLEAYILLLELSQGNYYRPAEIKPKQLMTRLLPSLEFMGTVQGRREDGVRKVLLPPPRKWDVQLQSPTGIPLRDRKVPVSIYMSRCNHCGVHQGVPLGTFVTDAEGRLRLRAPQSPLYLDIQYYEPDGPGFAGPMFAWTEGVKVYPDMRVVRQTWELPGETYLFEVRDGDGRPISGATLYEWQRTHLCGAFDGPLGHTDAQGRLKIEVTPQNVGRLEFRLGEQDPRELTEAELRQLFQEKKLVLTWPGTPDPDPERATRQ